MYRIDTLLKQDQKLFHTKDLALLWGIENQNTLYITISRYIKSGVLIPIHKGYYSTIPLSQLSPVRIGVGYLHRYAYQSCENVLIKAGIIFQKQNYITLISDVSKKFIVTGHQFLVRKMNDQYLYNNSGIEYTDGTFTATTERAVSDMLYFSPNYHFDNRQGIDWKKVQTIKKEVGY